MLALHHFEGFVWRPRQMMSCEEVATFWNNTMSCLGQDAQGFAQIGISLEKILAWQQGLTGTVLPEFQTGVDQALSSYGLEMRNFLGTVTENFATCQNFLSWYNANAWECFTAWKDWRPCDTGWTS